MLPLVEDKNKKNVCKELGSETNTLKISNTKCVFLDEVWIEILIFLPIKSVSLISLLNKKINIIQNSDTIWTIYAHSLQVKIVGDLHPKKQVEIELYRRHNPFFAAIEQVFPYQIYTTLPHSKEFMPKKFDLLSGWNLEIEENKLYKELLTKFREIPIIKFNENYIIMNIVDTNSVRKELHISYREKNLELYIGTHEQFVESDFGPITTVCCSSNVDCQFVIKYLDKLTQGDAVGQPLLMFSFTEGELPSYIEDGNSTMKLVPEKDLAEIQKLTETLKLEQPNWYL